MAKSKFQDGAESGSNSNGMNDDFSVTDQHEFYTTTEEKIHERLNSSIINSSKIPPLRNSMLRNSALIKNYALLLETQQAFFL